MDIHVPTLHPTVVMVVWYTHNLYVQSNVIDKAEVQPFRPGVSVGLSLCVYW